jgi:hypothetical protein
MIKTWFGNICTTVQNATRPFCRFAEYLQAASRKWRVQQPLFAMLIENLNICSMYSTLPKILSHDKKRLHLSYDLMRQSLYLFRANCFIIKLKVALKIIRQGGGGVKGRVWRLTCPSPAMDWRSFVASSTWARSMWLTGSFTCRNGK